MVAYTVHPFFSSYIVCLFLFRLLRFKRVSFFFTFPSSSHVSAMSMRAKTVCEICGESFLTENKLSNHITERHVHSSTSPSPSVGSSAKRRKLDADSDVRCPLCDYVDLDTDRLQQHVNRMHFDPGSPRQDGLVDFPCPICPLAFDHCDNLETHINEEHQHFVSPQTVTSLGPQIFNVHFIVHFFPPFTGFRQSKDTVIG